MATKKAKGLGDTIEQITEATGIKKAVELFSKATGIDCGCDERKAKLNELFSYSRTVNCLTEKDYNALTGLIDPKKSSLTTEEQAQLSDIYYNVFNYRLQISSCGSCWANKIQELKQVYNEYKIDVQ
ncbi:hypothetical protein UFOVP387_46 [uncultured Caudovirales phage]|uniref:Uncharacterized protein n=1 Tax=uncultured Caudovirales phage TaxID=2100421 RepID=A0A6J7X206_9CAUD|nr:hypothetical protein UFOVP387_46 [uncultured Caudovirales phage]